MTPALSQAIFELLTGDSELQDMVGNDVLPVRAGQGNVLPYIIYQEIDSPAAETHDDSEGLDFTYIQFSVYAKDCKLSLQIRKRLRTVIMAPGAIDGVKFTAPDSRQLYDEAIEAHNAQLDVVASNNPST